MAGVTKVNGYTEADQFFGRTIVGINVSAMTAAPAGAGVTAAWPELDAAVLAIETICTISVVGAFAATDTEVNMIIEGVDAVGDKYKSAGQNTYDMTIYEKLAELTGETVAAFAI